MPSINRLLENSKRSDLRGYNIYTMGRYAVSDEDYRAPGVEKWHSPMPGLFGTAAIGYEINTPDLVLLHVSCGGSLLAFKSMRHRWTPAYTDTYYRCDPIGEYRPSGTVVMREKKCFTKDDVFVSHLEFINDDSRPINLELSLAVPFDSIGDGVYRVVAETVASGLKKKPIVSGFASARTSLGTHVTIVLPPHGNARLSYGFAFSKKSCEAAVDLLGAALATKDPFAEAEKSFDAWMQANAPRLETENTDILKVYYYRFFLIKCAIHTPSAVLDDPVFVERAVYESPFGTWFGCPIGLPIPLQLEEMSWMCSDAAARDLIAAWCRGVGNTQNYIQYTPMAILRHYRQSGDLSILRDAYPACRAFALKKSGEEVPSRLPLTRGSWQTGAEYQPSFYQYTEPSWDWRQDNEGIRLGLFDSARELYRTDECTFHVANLMACRDIARFLDKTEDATYFEAAAEKAKTALKEALWCEETTSFFDRDKETDRLCDKARSYAGFFPFLFEIADEKQEEAIAFLEKEGFAGGFSTTTVVKDCPMYWYDSHITHGGESTVSDPHHYFSSWNGAIWPFASSLVLDAVGRVARHNPAYRNLFLRLFEEYTDLHFLGGDRALPCIVEHYRVSDGMPLSPYTEYFHSKWLDLFFSYWAGIGISDSGVTLSPMCEDDFLLDGVILCGKSYRFEKKQGRVRVHCNGPYSAR